MLRRGAGGVTALSVTANIAKTVRGKPVGSAAVAMAIWGADLNAKASRQATSDGSPAWRAA
jgi:hypothetical protein